MDQADVTELPQSLTINTTTELNQLMADLTSTSNCNSPIIGTFTRHIQVECSLTQDQLLALISRTTHLERLTLHDASLITDKELQKILPHNSACSALTYFCIRNSPLTHLTITPCSTLPHLTALVLDKCGGLKTDLFDTLVINYPQLQVLHVDVGGMTDLHNGLPPGGLAIGDGVVPMTEEDVAFVCAFNLAQLVHLKSLTICNLTPALVKHLLMSKEQPSNNKNKFGWPQLVSLSLSPCPGLRDQPTMDFVKAHPQLDTLVLEDADISNALLRTIGTHLQQLTCLALRGTPRITARGIRQLVMDCKHLKHLDVNGSAILAEDFPEIGKECMDQKMVPSRLTYLVPESFVAIRCSGLITVTTAPQENEQGDANDFSDGELSKRVPMDQAQAFSQLSPETQAYLFGHAEARNSRLKSMYV